MRPTGRGGDHDDTHRRLAENQGWSHRKHGASITAKDARGETPLNWASWHRRYADSNNPVI